MSSEFKHPHKELEFSSTQELLSKKQLDYLEALSLEEGEAQIAPTRAALRSGRSGSGMRTEADGLHYPGPSWRKLMQGTFVISLVCRLSLLKKKLS